MNAFVQFLTEFTPLAQSSQQALAAIAERLELPKGHVLTEADTIGESVYFIERGLSRTYYYKDGVDVTDWLSADNQIAGSIVSFLRQQPDCRTVQLLEPSITWAVPYHKLEALYQQHHDIERLGRLLISHGLVLLQERFDSLHMASAAARYQRLMDTQPSLIRRVPVGMLASYLGMAPETLSRIRARH